MRRRVTVALSRLTRILLLVAVAFCLGAPHAGAVPAKKLDDNLAALWTTILQTPAAQNPFLTDGCIHLGGTLAPFGAKGVESCTVKPGTKIFIAATSFECSTFPGDAPGPDATEEALRACLDNPPPNALVEPTAVTLDGKSVPVTLVDSPLLRIVLPEGNIFDAPDAVPPVSAPAGTKGQSVARGWVALLHPLTPGKHEIRIEFPNNTIDTINTTIDVVQPRP